MWTCVVVMAVMAVMAVQLHHDSGSGVLVTHVVGAVARWRSKWSHVYRDGVMCWRGMVRGQR